MYHDPDASTIEGYTETEKWMVRDGDFFRFFLIEESLI